jgi:hypothetical protein
MWPPPRAVDIIGPVADQVLEGTWEEVSRHAAELVGKRVRVTVLGEAEVPPRNEAMLEVLRRTAQRLKDQPSGGPTEESLKILREGRAGGMWGDEPTE